MLEQKLERKVLALALLTDTCRLLERSSLFPTSNLTTLSPANLFVSSIHEPTLSNDVCMGENVAFR